MLHLKLPRLIIIRLGQQRQHGRQVEVHPDLQQQHGIRLDQPQPHLVLAMLLVILPIGILLGQPLLLLQRHVRLLLRLQRRTVLLLAGLRIGTPQEALQQRIILLGLRLQLIIRREAPQQRI